MSPADCIFCSIASGKIKTDIIYEDKEFLAFKDINPQAPVHILVIPRAHIPSIAEVSSADIAGKLVLAATRIAKQIGVDKTGYRLAINYGEDAHLVVPHLHLHIVGGRKLDDMLG
jgi:histidine triad (HIT) family protein